MFAACLAGCGRSGPDVQMVLGKVTLDGQPLPGATVTFTPLASGAGRAAIGMTDEQGSFRLTAVRGGPPQRGTTIGDYAVNCMKVTHDIPGKPKEVPPPAGPLPVFHLVPEAYESDSTSGLRATVKRGVNQGPEFTFDLRSDFRGE